MCAKQLRHGPGDTYKAGGGEEGRERGRERREEREREGSTELPL